MELDRIQLFSKATCGEGNYRIPAMIVTNSGVVVAAADERIYGGGDNPNRIDKIVRRSKDSGKTWEDKIVVVKEVGKSKMHASAAIDPALLYDDKNNRIYMLYTHTPAGIGILNTHKGTGLTKDGDLLVYSKDKQYVKKDGALYENGTKTDYTINEEGDVSLNGEYKGNICVGDKDFKEKETFFLMLTYSDDEGLTWCKPICLNNQVKDEKFGFLGAGPGIGLRISKGKYAGRLVFPVYYSKGPSFMVMLSATTIYSDDNGKTWNIGVSPNNTRKRLGFLPMNDKFLFPNESITECQIIECSDGHLKMFMRNHSGKKLIALVDSYDGGVTWENFRYQSQLVHCICQLSVITTKDVDKDVTVFLNAADKKTRQNGVIRLSYDEGEHFEYSRCLKEGGFVYSSMAKLPDGTLGVLYEPSTQHETVDFVKVDFDWIKDKEYQV